METKAPTMTVQRLSKEADNPIALAQRYYGLISSLNDLFLTEREIQLIAFSAIKGSISLPHVREEFCQLYNSSAATINNMLSSRLRKMGIFVKDIHKNDVVNPQLALDFSKPIVLQVSLSVPKKEPIKAMSFQTITQEAVLVAPGDVAFNSKINGKANNNAIEGVSYKEAGS